MKVDKIIPCICTELKNDGSDGFYDGMPILHVCGGKPITFFSAQCPKCGRGGIYQYNSAFKALRAWNFMQENLRNNQWLNSIISEE